MKSDGMAVLDVLVGDWKITMTEAWFLESMDTEIHGSAKFEWIGSDRDAFLQMTSELNGEPAWDYVIGRSDPHDAFTALSHDERGVSRVFQMTFRDGEWTMLREDPDFHQRLVSTVEPDRIVMRADASDDEGQTWRMDLKVYFERVG
jgi:hypothetical protein